MLLKLSINDNTTKGKNFKEDTSNIDVDDPKRGLIDNKNCCSCLNQCRYDSILKCCTCDSSYHSVCIKRPISNEGVKLFTENPNCFWSCLSCLINYQVSEKPNDAIMEEVQNCLQNFKSQMIEDMSTLISSKLSNVLPETECRKRRRSSSEVVQSASKIIRTHSDVSSDAVITVNTDADSLITDIRNANNSNFSDTPSSESVSITPHLHVAHPQQELNKFILHFRPISPQLAITTHAEWHEARKNLGKKLKGIKISFSRFDLKKNGRVKIGFPSKDDMDRAKSIIDSHADHLWSYENYVPALLLPKLTVYNIPLDFDVPNSHSETNSATAEFRDAVKLQLRDTILEKNDTVREFIEQNKSTLDIIYVQKHKHNCTAALRVSPDLRNHILNSCDAKLYLFSSRCRVEDRFFYYQCFHCQKLGHMSSDCPKKDNPPVCMYCSGNHFSRQCCESVKKDFNKQCCANCKSSNDTVISQNSTGHSAASQKCPITVQYIMHIKSRTQLADPKNHHNH